MNQSWIVFFAIVGIAAATSSGSSAATTPTTHTTSGAYSLHPDDTTYNSNGYDTGLSSIPTPVSGSQYGATQYKPCEQTDYKPSACYHPSGYSSYCAKVPSHYYGLGCSHFNHFSCLPSFFC